MIKILKYLTELNCDDKSFKRDEFRINENDLKGIIGFYNRGLDLWLQSKEKSYLNEFSLIYKKETNSKEYIDSRKEEIRKYIRYKIYFLLLLEKRDPREFFGNQANIELKTIKGIEKYIDNRY